MHGIVGDRNVSMTKNMMFKFNNRHSWHIHTTATIPNGQPINSKLLAPGRRLTSIHRYMSPDSNKLNCYLHTYTVAGRIIYGS